MKTKLLVLMNQSTGLQGNKLMKSFMLALLIPFFAVTVSYAQLVENSIPAPTNNNQNQRDLL